MESEFKNILVSILSRGDDEEDKQTDDFNTSLDIMNKSIGSSDISRLCCQALEKCCNQSSYFRVEAVNALSNLLMKSEDRSVKISSAQTINRMCRLCTPSDRDKLGILQEALVKLITNSRSDSLVCRPLQDALDSVLQKLEALNKLVTTTVAIPTDTPTAPSPHKEAVIAKDTRYPGPPINTDKDLLLVLAKVGVDRWLGIRRRMSTFYIPDVTTPKTMEKHFKLTTDQLGAWMKFSCFHCKSMHPLSEYNYNRLQKSIDKLCELSFWTNEGIPCAHRLRRGGVETGDPSQDAIGADLESDASLSNQQHLSTVSLNGGNGGRVVKLASSDADDVGTDPLYSHDVDLTGAVVTFSRTVPAESWAAGERNHVQSAMEPSGNSVERRRYEGESRFGPASRASGRAESSNPATTSAFYTGVAAVYGEESARRQPPSLEEPPPAYSTGRHSQGYSEGEGRRDDPRDRARDNSDRYRSQDKDFARPRAPEPRYDDDRSKFFAPPQSGYPEPDARAGGDHYNQQQQQQYRACPEYSSDGRRHEGYADRGDRPGRYRSRSRSPPLPPRRRSPSPPPRRDYYPSYDADRVPPITAPSAYRNDGATSFLMIRNLPLDIKLNELLELTVRSGVQTVEPRDIVIPPVRNATSTGNHAASPAHAFINFTNVGDARRVRSYIIEVLVSLRGHKLQIEYAYGKPGPVLYVGDIGRLSEGQIMRFMKDFGDVERVEICRHMKSAEVYAKVSFTSSVGAVAALKELTRDGGSQSQGIEGINVRVGYSIAALGDAAPSVPAAPPSHRSAPPPSYDRGGGGRYDGESSDRQDHWEWRNDERRGSQRDFRAQDRDNRADWRPESRQSGIVSGSHYSTVRPDDRRPVSGSGRSRSRSRERYPPHDYPQQYARDDWSSRGGRGGRGPSRDQSSQPPYGRGGGGGRFDNRDGRMFNANQSSTYSAQPRVSQHYQGPGRSTSHSYQSSYQAESDDNDSMDTYRKRARAQENELKVETSPVRTRHDDGHGEYHEGALKDENGASHNYEPEQAQNLEPFLDLTSTTKGERDHQVTDYQTGISTRGYDQYDYEPDTEDGYAM